MESSISALLLYYARKEENETKQKSQHWLLIKLLSLEFQFYRVNLIILTLV